MGNSTSRKSLAPIIVFGLYTLADIITIIILAITYRHSGGAGELVIRYLLPLLIVPFLGFTGIIIYRTLKKKQEKRHQTEQDVLMKMDVAEKESKEEIKLVFKPIVFQGDRENQICSLCNKAVKEGHVILICPKCASLFHYDHLLDWLTDNPLCPVCHEDL